MNAIRNAFRSPLLLVTVPVLLALAGPARAEASHELLAQSDTQARREAPALRALYEGAGQAFARGDHATAFRDYDYAAWQGSVAAAGRLCVLDAYGIGSVPNPVKAAFWCERAAAGGNALPAVERYLGDFRVGAR